METSPPQKGCRRDTNHVEAVGIESKCPLVKSLLLGESIAVFVFIGKDDNKFVE